MLKLICSALFILISFKAHASYMYSVGTYVQYFNKMQISTSGETEKFDLNPYFGAGTQLALSGPHYFMPEVGYAYFMSSNQHYRKEILFLHYNFAYVMSSDFTLRYGLTNHWYRLVGKGGSQTLSNGNSKTTFPNPDRTVTSYFTTLNIGGELFFKGNQYGLRFDLNTMSFRNLDNKAFNYLLTFNFYR